MSRIIILTIIGCLSFLTIGHAGHAHEFGYVSPIGPANWSTLDPNWLICGIGNRQSPINIPTHESVYWPQLNLKITNGDKMLTGTLLNNKHTVEYSINSAEESRPTFVAKYKMPHIFRDAVYELLQFHFHWGASGSGKGSENQFDGSSSVAEMHFVSRNIRYNSSQAGNEADGYLVLAILLRVCENSGLYPVFGKGNTNLIKIRYYPDEVLGISLRLNDIYQL